MRPARYVRYSSSFRWLKFAVVAVFGSLAVGSLLALALAGLGYPDMELGACLLTFIPFAIWYLRRTARDRAEFEAGQGLK